MDNYLTGLVNYLNQVFTHSSFTHLKNYKISVDVKINMYFTGSVAGLLAAVNILFGAGDQLGLRITLMANN